MKRIFLPLLLISISLVSCSDTNKLYEEKFYPIRGNKANTIEIYDDETSNYLEFKDDVLNVIGYNSPENEYTNIGKRKIYYKLCYYFNISENFIYSSVSSWYEIRGYESGENSSNDLFRKPIKSNVDFTLCGEYGDGWVKMYSRNETMYDKFSLYVTEKYAMKVGLKIVRYSFDEASNEYVISSNSVN